MPVLFEGEPYPIIAQDKLTPGEIDAVERATGLTLQKMRRMGQTCVCEHDYTLHAHKDAAGEQDAEDTSCTACGCLEHEGDQPSRVTTAFIWVSIRRVKANVTFANVSGSVLEMEADPEDPTQAPPEALPVEG
jgi:hypothetical protein